MSFYSERQKVYSLLNEYNIDGNRFVVGAGNTFVKKGKQKRYEFNATNREQILEKTAEYAVKYYIEHGFYLLWKVYGRARGIKLRRGLFSVNYDDVMQTDLAYSDVQKGVEFTWRGTESVLVLSYEGLVAFLANLSEQLIKNEGDE